MTAPLCCRWIRRKAKKIVRAITALGRSLGMTSPPKALRRTGLHKHSGLRCEQAQVSCSGADHAEATGKLFQQADDTDRYLASNPLDENDLTAPRRPGGRRRLASAYGSAVRMVVCSTSPGPGAA